jgi:hypothetical protein
MQERDQVSNVLQLLLLAIAIAYAVHTRRKERAYRLGSENRKNRSTWKLHPSNQRYVYDLVGSFRKV